MEVCRVCLKKGVLTSIYEKDMNDITLSDKIMDCGGILIRPSVDLPEYICAKCLTNLDVAYTFRSTCRKSDSILQLYLKANNRNNIFLTLSSGRTYKLPEDLKLKIVKVKKEEKLEIDNPPVQSKATNEDTVKTDNGDSNQLIIQENLKCEIEKNFAQVNVDDISYETDNEDNFNAEMSYETDNEKISSENLENVHPQSIKIESLVAETEQVPVKRKSKRISTKKRKDHIPLKKILRQVRSSSPPKYLRYSSSSEDEPSQQQTKRKEKPVRRPDDKPSFICEICGNVYKQNSLLRTHMRRHNNERPFSCEICGKSFVTSSLMARHIKIHTGHKPYKCQFCNRRFYERGTCRAHEKVHSGERPYECRECGKRFIYSQSLTKHTLIHTGEKLYSCDLCGKEFRLYHHLKAHLQTNVHKNSSMPEAEIS